MKKSIIRVALVCINAYQGKERISLKVGDTLPDSLSAETIDELERLKAFEEKIVPVADTLSAEPAGELVPGTNTSAADQGSNADVSGTVADSSAAATPSAPIAPPDATETAGDTPPVGEPSGVIDEAPAKSKKAK